MVGSRSVRRRGVLVCALALAGCGASDLFGPDALQGIEGVALRGPICPVQRPNDPACEPRPHQADVVVFTEGRFVTSFRTGEDGRFRVGLPTGHYRLVPESGDPFPVAQVEEVEVVVGVYAEVTLSFDTGIR